MAREDERLARDRVHAQPEPGRGPAAPRRVLPRLAGPARARRGAHGTSGAIFLYAFEPSGHRVEVWTGGLLLFAPDWEPIRWDRTTGPLGLEMWGSEMPATYLSYGTPLAAAAAIA